MLFNRAYDHLFVYLREFPADTNLPIGSQMETQIEERAADSVRGLEEHRESGL